MEPYALFCCSHEPPLSSGYEPYEVGLADDVFLKGHNGAPYLGWVWPGPTHFPDFLHERGRTFFSTFLAKHHDLIPWDGIWIDMDEVITFGPAKRITFSPSL